MAPSDHAILTETDLCKSFLLLSITLLYTDNLGILCGIVESRRGQEVNVFDSFSQYLKKKQKKFNPTLSADLFSGESAGGLFYSLTSSVFLDPKKKLTNDILVSLVDPPWYYISDFISINSPLFCIPTLSTISI